jgi:hypothetical protein
MHSRQRIGAALLSASAQCCSLLWVRSDDQPAVCRKSTQDSGERCARRCLPDAAVPLPSSPPLQVCSVWRLGAQLADTEGGDLDKAAHTTDTP